jgi:hypothetical protein
MRRFFLALGVEVQIVAWPLPHVIQAVQGSAQGVIRYLLPRRDFQNLMQKGQGPTRVGVAQFLGGEGEEGLQQVQLVFVQERGTPPPFLILQRGGVEGLRVCRDPVMHTLPGHAKHPGDIGSGTAVVKLQNGQGTPEEAGIPGLQELTSETLPLPGSQVEPAHVLLLHH